jgi:dimethylhistidine N-methyltransferase
VASFRDDLLLGMSSQPRRIPSMYLYDRRGSELFEHITKTSEYYVSRTETLLLTRHAHAIASCAGEDVELIELGAAGGQKTRQLLRSLKGVALYMPIDSAKEALGQSVLGLRKEFSSLAIQPVCADFNGELTLPERRRTPGRTLIYFGGSTISNLTPDEAARLLSRMRSVCGAGGGMLVTVDLKKDPAVLHRAYNDDAGVTAAFNLNVLVRANRELGARFCLDQFRHYAYYEPQAGRIVMTLVSTARQTCAVASVAVELEEGEPIVTEYSYKYALPQFTRLTQRSGWQIEELWVDERRFLALVLLRA